MTSSGRNGRAGRRNSASADRRRLRALEDALALLLDVDQERVRIKRVAYDLAQTEIYQAAERQKKALARLKAALSERWHYLMSDLEDTN